MMTEIKLAPREERVVKYLKNKTPFIFSEVFMRRYGNTKGITVKECIDVLGTTELRKIISTLREKGFVVTDIWEDDVNRFGEAGKHKRYFISSKKRKENK